MERFFSLSNLGCDDLVEQFLKNLNVCNLFKVQREISHRNSKENEGEKKLYGENIIYKWMEQMYIYIFERRLWREYHRFEKRNQNTEFLDAVLSTYSNGIAIIIKRKKRKSAKMELSRPSGITIHLIFSPSSSLYFPLSTFRTKASLPPSRLSRFDCLIFPARERSIILGWRRSPSKSASTE